MTNAFIPLSMPAGFSAQRLFTVNHSATAAGGAEVAAYDPALRLAFIMGPNGVDIVNAVARPGKPAGTILAGIDVTPFGGNANSIAFHDGLLAIALAGPDKTQPGTVLTFRIGGEVDPVAGFRPTVTPVATYTVGANPDQITFTPDGTKLLVANEGEPNGYRPGDVDPEGSVSIIDLASGTVRTADFTAFNGEIDALRAAGVRIFGPGASVAQDLEPEYITLSADGKTAFVALQENNAIAVLDIEQAAFVSILPLGLKDHSLPGNGLDASDRDGAWTRNAFNGEGIPGLTGGAVVAGEARNTPGALNAPPPLPPPGPVITRISAVQGPDDTSPLLGQTVTVEAIVVGDFQNGDADTRRNLSGFFLQEETDDWDADSLTSEGLVIFQPSGVAGAVSLGDRVRVTGTVEEFFGLTQLRASAITVV